MRILRGSIAALVWLTGLPFNAVGAVGAALSAVASVIAGKEPLAETEPEHPVLEHVKDWHDLGLMAFGLMREEFEARGRTIDPEVVETQLDVESGSVRIVFRAMNPDENGSDAWRAHMSQGFAITPKIAADMATKDEVRRVQEARRALRG
ncbi:MAG: hypothetical protein ABIH03_05145 [Pseudomonadota bacterium]